MPILKRSKTLTAMGAALETGLTVEGHHRPATAAPRGRCNRARIGIEQPARGDGHAQRKAEPVRALLVPTVDLSALGKDKTKSAIRTDFVLSADFILITPGTVATAPFATRVTVSGGIAALMTIGVQGLVAAIAKRVELRHAEQADDGIETALGTGERLGTAVDPFGSRRAANTDDRDAVHRVDRGEACTPDSLNTLKSMARVRPSSRTSARRQDLRLTYCGCTQVSDCLANGDAVGFRLTTRRHSVAGRACALTPNDVATDRVQPVFNSMRTVISAVSPVSRRHRLLARAALYLELTKPKVVTLIVFTAVVGMLLANPVVASAHVLLLATIGISLAAGSAAAFNHVLDMRADAIMNRTRSRPLPTQQVLPHQVVMFAAALALLSTAILVVGVNALTAVLTLFALVGYSVVYTIYLKPRTPQNIVIGGAAGAAPPVLGWAAVNGSVSTDALLLFLIIFVWTPPHFWSLALHRETDYARAGIPMLPVTHGSVYTRKCILRYTVLLAIVAMLPFATGMSGMLYLIGAVALNARFVAYAWQLYRDYSDSLARRTFRFSIQYLAALFALLLIDHYSTAFGDALSSLLIVPRF